MPPESTPRFHGNYRRAVLAGKALDVDMGQARFLDMRGDVKTIGTEGNRGCFGVIIGSRYGGIIAHISPMDLDTPLRQIQLLYIAKREAHFEGMPCWIVKPAVLEGLPGASEAPSAQSTAAVELVKNRIKEKLASFGLVNPGSASYAFHFASGGNSPEFPDKGTIHMTATSSETTVFVENRVLYRFYESTHSTPPSYTISSAYATSSYASSLRSATFPYTVSSDRPSLPYATSSVQMANRAQTTSSTPDFKTYDKYLARRGKYQERQGFFYTDNRGREMFSDQRDWKQYTTRDHGVVYYHEDKKIILRISDR